MGIDIFNPLGELMYFASFDGQMVPVGKIKDMDLTIVDEACGEELAPMKLNSCQSYAFTCEKTDINIWLMIKAFAPECSGRLAHLAACAKKARTRKKNWRRAFESYRKEG